MLKAGYTYSIDPDGEPEAQAFELAFNLRFASQLLLSLSLSQWRLI